MKRLIIFVLAAACIGMIWPQKASAFDLSVGATTWYAWWDMNVDREGHAGESYERDIDPAFLYGPVISLKFSNDFNLTFAYLYGKFDFKDDFNVGVPNRIYGTKKRSDGDLAINYRLNNYLKVFAGVKVMTYEYKIEYDHGASFKSFRIEHSVMVPEQV